MNIWGQYSDTTEATSMNKTRVLPDGCDIAVFNYRGEMIIEYNDVPKEVSVRALNILQQLIINEDHRRRARQFTDDQENYNRLEELLENRTKRLMPKPIRRN